MADAKPKESVASGGAPVPVISLPKGGGAIHGIGEKFASNPVTGTCSFSIPLAISPGRSGLGPQLTLTYDSGSGNGPFGLGWSLSLTSVTRKTDKGLPRYDDAEESDVFLLSGAEDLVPVFRKDGMGGWELDAGGKPLVDEEEREGYSVRRYRPRTEGLFARIERWTRASDGDMHWRSISKDNVTTLYGKSAESRIADAADPTRVFSWLICESYDDKGNALVYDYVSEDDRSVELTMAHERNRVRTANRYLKRVSYGNRISRLVQPGLTELGWMFEVVFDYDEGHCEALDHNPALPEDEQQRLVLASASPARPWAARPDQFSSHRAGFEVRTHRRCRRALMFHRFPELGDESRLVRATEFEYADLDYSQPTTIEAELDHQGSTRFASFLCAVNQSGFVRDETRPPLERDGVTYITYLQKSLPPLEFEYSKASIEDTVREVDAASLGNLPVGLDGETYQWVDLDGEGVSGVLTEHAGAWFYKPNMGGGRLGPQEAVVPRPTPAGLRGGGQRLLDLAGDGQLDLVSFSGPTPGFFERTDDRNWESFRVFASLPELNWNEANLSFVDLNGDGHADLLITEDEVFTWYPSLAEEGFGPARKVRRPTDEERGPRLLLDDGTQSVYLADMSGDGLTDLVRVRNGEVCYWPNCGYGSFGAKVTMDDAPWFDNPDQFDRQRVRIADIDGSGTTDIIYLGRDGVRLYFNQSGNRWSGPRRLRQFPHVDSLSAVTTADLLGNGTACLVWSSPLPGEARRPMRYIDLMGGKKPHLLIASINNLGAETHVQYAPSTKFYLADKLAGKPWVTRIPFPVHVVERVESFDRISGNRFVTTYAYRHGYYDGIEREFRGFGLVEQRDTEVFSALDGDPGAPPPTNLEESSHVPPTLTRTWFHTGASLVREKISNYFAGLLDSDDAGEYYREPGLTDAQARQLLLEDTVLPGGLTVGEEREACRALRGSMLRQEVFALDGTDQEQHPYTVNEQNFTTHLLQPKGGNRHAVFFTHPRETITYQYERNPADPRLTHTLTLEVDEFGNVLKSAAVSYGRRQPDPALAPQDRTAQGGRLVTYTESDVTNCVEAPDDYRTPLPSESRTYELTGLVLPAGQSRFTFAGLVSAAAAAAPIAYEVSPTPGTLQKRLIERVRTIYRRDNLAGPLSLGRLQTRALVFESYKLAFTPGLLAEVYGGRVTDAMPADEGRYVQSAGDAGWWIPSGRAFYSPNPADTQPAELAYARAHFFLPCRYRNPFHTGAVSTETFVVYDDYDLLVRETRDPFGNRVTAGERPPDPTQPLVSDGLDYRVLQPTLLMDANRNRTAFAFDALGMVVGIAAMGKPGEEKGDSLSGLTANLTEAAITGYFESPLADPSALLGRATTRFVYDLFAYFRTRGRPAPRPSAVSSLARETHDADLADGRVTLIQQGFSYSDGFGREIQKKIRAEPGPVPERDPATGHIMTVNGQPLTTPNERSPRWVGSGWKVYNNKANPVREYEPFFTDTHRFEFDVRIGHSPVFFYDPVGRKIATLHPNHAWEKVVFDSWRQETWDVNDTLLVTDPKSDPDVGDFFRRLPDAEYLPTWRAQRQGGALGPLEQAAAARASVHANTPTVAYSDPLGRIFLTVVHNKFEAGDTPAGDPPTEQFYSTRVLFDIEGNERAVIDALRDPVTQRGRVVMRYDYDMQGVRIHQASMDAGEHWVLYDVAGKPIYAWDSRNQQTRAAYDQLRRPTESYLREGAGPEMLVIRTVYGETQPAPEATNLRGKIARIFDQAGVVLTDEYDFKGNLLRNSRQFAREYKATLDWSAAVPLETEVFTSLTGYDALNRPAELTAPDNSLIRTSYNDANLLESVVADLRGQGVAIPFITDIDYDAKGQRTLIDYGNGVRTTCEYDPLTTRLAHLFTRRNAVAFPDDCPQPAPPGRPGCHVQNLSYTYDPVGNINFIRDDAQQSVYFRNRRVEPSAGYTYDATYRLIEATGREHLGLNGGSQPNPPTSPDAFNTFHAGHPHPGDGNAVGTYVERYVYDAVGNILSMRHLGSDPVHPGWTRTYAYNELSQLEPGRVNNRLSSTTVGDTTETCLYTAPAGVHGNITAMSHLPLMRWDYLDQLKATARQVVNNGSTPETTWYVYGAGGQRVRKVTERQAKVGQTPARKAERLYLGGFEIYREYENDGDIISLERETLHLMDGERRIAMVETRTVGVDPVPAQLIRYQFGNHLGSSSLELDDRAQIVSYEEYFPYGGTSYQAVENQIETPKRYRFTGKERDEQTGFYYHGARYYAPWLGRWTAADPSGIDDGVNVYAYVKGRVCNAVDEDGRQSLFTYGLQVNDRVQPKTPADRVAVARATGRAVGREYGEALAVAEKAMKFFHVEELEKRGSKGKEEAEKLRQAIKADLQGVLTRLPSFEESWLQDEAMAEFRRQTGHSYIRAKLEIAVHDIVLDLVVVGTLVAASEAAFRAIQATARGVVGPLLRAATQEVAAEAIASGKKLGPVVAGVTDLRTGRTIFVLNAEGIPQNLHPILEARLKALQKSPQHFSEPGFHAEVHALNDALWAREAATGRAVTERELGEFILDTAWLRGSGKGRMVPGQPAPRCGNCAPLTEGVINMAGDAPPRPPNPK